MASRDENTGHVVFVEDKLYLLWQLELFIYSLHRRGKVPLSNIVVLYASPEYHNPDKTTHGDSEYIKSLRSYYPTVKFLKVQNWGRSNWYYRFNDNGSWHSRQYPGINKWSSLCEAANAGWLDQYNEILLLEQDLWFSDIYPTLPPGNCCTDNWINDRYNAFEVKDKGDNNTPGFDLDDIMKLCKVKGVDREKWIGGAIIFKFITKELKSAKFLNAIMNYNQLLMTLGELALPQGARHETDMVAPSLAMAHAGMSASLVTNNKWRSDIWTWDQEIPRGTVVHYGWDFNNYGHLGCKFSKFKYSSITPYEDIKNIYMTERKNHKFEWTQRYIYDLFKISKIKINRKCNNNVSVPII